MPGKFTLRKAWYQPGTALGFNVRPYANKNSLTVTVGSRATFLERQEQGGVKTPRGELLALPEAIRSSKEQLIPTKDRPRQVLKRKKTFTIPRVGIFKDLPGGEHELLYLFIKQVRVELRLQIVEGGVKIANKNFDAHFDRRFAAALALVGEEAAAQ